MTPLPSAEEFEAKIQAALADPDAPWYGSDLVEWVGALLAEVKQLRRDESIIEDEWDKEQAENARLREALQKAADTFADVGKFLKFISKTDAALACEIAETETRRTLKAQP